MGETMNIKQIARMLIVVLAALALTALVAAAQDAPAAPQKALPGSVERGESASPAANLNESEPNNGFAAADVITLGDVISGKIGNGNDRDFYVIDVPSNVEVLIDIDAQANGSALDPVICLYDGDRQELGCSDDSDGLDSLLYYNLYDHWAFEPYYVWVQDYSYPNEGGNTYTYTLSVYNPLLISAAKGGTVAGIRYQPADVLAHYDFPDGTQKWSLFFDASDVGITKNIVGIAHAGVDWFHIALANSQVLWIDGQQQTVTPYDVFTFRFGQYGPNTWGDLTIDDGVNCVLTGQQWGLTGSSERIDALDRSDVLNCKWWVSTTGAATFSSGLAAKDEDISMLPNGELYLDGSQVPGLAVEDVIGVDSEIAGIWDPFNHVTWYLTILGNGVIDGHTFTQKDIFVMDSNYNVTGLYWHGPDHGFNGNIDAIEVTNH